MRRYFKLLSFARLLLAQDSLLPPGFSTRAPWLIRALRYVLTLGAPTFNGQESRERGEALSRRLQALGPTYIKLGQSLATRPDVIGIELSRDLHYLQDRLPPFADTEVDMLLADQLDVPKDDLFAEFGPPIAAASIAQVHKATLRDGRQVAVKLLRPGIEKQLAAELRTFFLARLTERLIPAARRIKPVAAVQTLADSVRLELDLRLEAAALSEMGDNVKDDPHYTVPEVVWQGTSKQMLTMSWMDGIKLSDTDGLQQAGHDLPDLAAKLLQAFLTHAIRDGFFHGDMHQGNLLADPDGNLIGIDLGIAGRLDKDSRRFLAEILYGFITRDYMKIAEVHFEAGYVSDTKNMDAFAQALRSIGEPISGQNADTISMARLLTQLFEVTEQFDMETQPQLLLLQKTMVVVEGVARSLDPQLNIWTISEPTVSAWLRAELGPEAAFKDAAAGLKSAAKQISKLPETLTLAERNLQRLDTILTEDGLLHPDMAESSKSQKPLWIAVAATAGLALAALVL